jgi:hypothetical protein
MKNLKNLLFTKATVLKQHEFQLSIRALFCALLLSKPAFGKSALTPTQIATELLDSCKTAEHKTPYALPVNSSPLDDAMSDLKQRLKADYDGVFRSLIAAVDLFDFSYDIFIIE